MTDAWDGRPQNPERDGAHVIYDRHLRHETAVLWSCATQQYHDMASMVTPVGAAKWWEYRGPCLTPAEIAAREVAAYQRGQREALERLAVRLQDRALVEQPVGDDWGYTRAGLQLGAEIARTMEIQESPDAAE